MEIIHSLRRHTPASIHLILIIAFHKPYGVLCQFTPDQPDQRTLAEFDFPQGVYPLGRLDMDSEGLLLLTDEGRLNQMLLNPTNAHQRTYRVQVEGIPDAAAIRKLEEGTIVIKNHRCLPCEAKVLQPQPLVTPRDPPIRVRKSVPDCWIEIRLTEGKNRQVRRMTAAVSHPTLRLVRVAIGDFTAADLRPGEWRILDENEIRRIGI
jgi:23S rRNA pseudouridine2457 synthase